MKILKVIINVLLLPIIFVIGLSYGLLKLLYAIILYLIINPIDRFVRLNYHTSILYIKIIRYGFNPIIMFKARKLSDSIISTELILENVDNEKAKQIIGDITWYLYYIIESKPDIPIKKVVQNISYLSGDSLENLYLGIKKLGNSVREGVV